MLRKVWQIRSVLFLVGLLVAFAACVKQRNPEQDMKDVKALADEVMVAIDQGNLSGLNELYVQPTPEGKGPNAMLGAVTHLSQGPFAYYNKQISVDREDATLRFTFSSAPDDSTFSYIYFHRNGKWKVSGFEFK